MFPNTLTYRVHNLDNPPGGQMGGRDGRAAGAAVGGQTRAPKPGRQTGWANWTGERGGRAGLTGTLPFSSEVLDLLLFKTSREIVRVDYC